ncbi:hypothetical protein V6N13_060490 [Hibiscus sabdariffa]|uniref:Uncharacterized protein n=1 Tax=Hibiscus sabdariffa TaxID=183260 RepID=A0ABR2GB04_9ROSI
MCLSSANNIPFAGHALPCFLHSTAGFLSRIFLFPYTESSSRLISRRNTRSYLFPFQRDLCQFQGSSKRCIS